MSENGAISPVLGEEWFNSRWGPEDQRRGNGKYS